MGMAGVKGERRHAHHVLVPPSFIHSPPSIPHTHPEESVDKAGGRQVPNRVDVELHAAVGVPPLAAAAQSQAALTLRCVPGENWPWPASRGAFRTPPACRPLLL